MRTASEPGSWVGRWYDQDPHRAAFPCGSRGDANTATNCGVTADSRVGSYPGQGVMSHPAMQHAETNDSSNVRPDPPPDGEDGVEAEPLHHQPQLMTKSSTKSRCFSVLCLSSPRQTLHSVAPTARSELRLSERGPRTKESLERRWYIDPGRPLCHHAGRGRIAARGVTLETKAGEAEMRTKSRRLNFKFPTCCSINGGASVIAIPLAVDASPAGAAVSPVGTYTNHYNNGTSASNGHCLQ